MTPESTNESAAVGHAGDFADADGTDDWLEQCRAWLDWAATQIAATLGADAAASNQLLESIAKVMGSAESRTRSEAAAGGRCEEQQMTAVITAVQAHDRVTQGLAHVAQSLRALNELLADSSRVQCADAWRMLRDKQYRTFSMHEERMLFARMVGRGYDGVAVKGTVDSVELFDAKVEPGRS